MSQTATSFTPGIEVAMRASPEPMPPAPIRAIWMLSFAAGMESRFHRHGGRVPFTDALLEITKVRKQRGTGGAETEHRIFNHRLAAADGVEEVTVMVDVVAVALRRQIFFLADGANGIGRGTGRTGMVLAVLLQERFLDGLREGVDGVAWLRFTRLLRNR